MVGKLDDMPEKCILRQTGLGGNETPVSVRTSLAVLATMGLEYLSGRTVPLTNSYDRASIVARSGTRGSALFGPRRGGAGKTLSSGDIRELKIIKAAYNAQVAALLATLRRCPPILQLAGEHERLSALHDAAVSGLKNVAGTVVARRNAAARLSRHCRTEYAATSKVLLNEQEGFCQHPDALAKACGQTGEDPAQLSLKTPV